MIFDDYPVPNFGTVTKISQSDCITFAHVTSDGRSLIPVQIQVSQLFLQVRCTRVRNSRYYETSCQPRSDPLAIMVPLSIGPRSPNGIISIFSCDASRIKYNCRKTTTAKRNLINLFFLIPVLLCGAGPGPKLVNRT